MNGKWGKGFHNGKVALRPPVEISMVFCPLGALVAVW